MTCQWKEKQEQRFSYKRENKEENQIEKELNEIEEEQNMRQTFLVTVQWKYSIVKHILFNWNYKEVYRLEEVK